MDDLNTTPGPWIVMPKKEIKIRHADDGRDVILTGNFTVIETDEEHNKVIALMQLGDSQADAALMAAAPELLDALIQVSDLLNRSKEVININAINEIISAAIEKIYAEVS